MTVDDRRSQNPLEAEEVDPDIALPSLWRAIVKSPHVGVAVMTTRGELLRTNAHFEQVVSTHAAVADSNVDDEGMRCPESEPFVEERIEIVREFENRDLPIVLRQARHGGLVDMMFAPWSTSLRHGVLRKVVCFVASSPDVGTLCSADEFEGRESRYADWGKLALLTHRQAEVLALIAENYSYSEAAEILMISAKTVETHRDQLVRKLRVATTREAIRLALCAGLTVERFQRTTSVQS